MIFKPADDIEGFSDIHDTSATAGKQGKFVRLRHTNKASGLRNLGSGPLRDWISSC